MTTYYFTPQNSKPPPALVSLTDIAAWHHTTPHQTLYFTTSGCTQHNKPSNTTIKDTTAIHTIAGQKVLRSASKQTKSLNHINHCKLCQGLYATEHNTTYKQTHPSTAHNICQHATAQSSSYIKCGSPLWYMSKRVSYTQRCVSWDHAGSAMVDGGTTTASVQKSLFSSFHLCLW